MPKPTKGARLGGSPTHERIILRNLATQLFDHGRITTTETRARRVQPLAEKLRPGMSVVADIDVAGEAGTARASTEGTLPFGAR